MHHTPSGPASDAPGDLARAADADPGTCTALVFALVAERLSAYYEHGCWLTEAQGAQLCAEWLARTRRRLPPVERKRLSAISDALARDVAATLSREAGLATTHALLEALDPNQRSDIAEALMAECARRLAPQSGRAPPDTRHGDEPV